MWDINKLKVKNLLSHSNSEFDFPSDKMTLIFGYNEDDTDKGADSNGSGKSVIIEGITLALTGSTYREIDKDDWIKDDEKACMVELYLINNFLNKKMSIVWNFVRGKTATVEIKINDEIQKQLTSVNEAKKFILEQIGVGREDLLNYYIINQGNSNSFFTSGDAKQKEIISRFTNYKIVEEVIKKITEELKEIETCKNELEKQITTKDGNIESYNTLINEERELLEKEAVDNTEELKTEIKTEEKSIKDNTVEIEKLNTNIKTQQVGIKNIDDEIAEHDEVLQGEEELNKELKTQRKILQEKEQKLNEYKTQEGGKIECPECKHKFLLNNKLSLEDIQKLIIKFNGEIKTQKVLIEDNEKLLEMIQESKDAVEELKGKKKPLNKKIEGFEDQIEEYNSLISKSNRNIKRLNEQIEENKKQKIKESNIPTYEAKIKEVEAEKEVLNKKLEIEVAKKLEKDFWILHLGKKGFQTYLANKCISAIENTCNLFLEIMNTNLKVQINGYKVLASGELREKIDIQVLKDGVNAGKFAKYSGGQKMKISLAGMMTLQRLMNESLNGKGLNILCCDETLDFLDVTGTKMCLDMLQKIDTPTMIVSHNQIENLITDYNKISVFYKNRTSTVKYE